MYKEKDRCGGVCVSENVYLWRCTFVSVSSTPPRPTEINVCGSFHYIDTESILLFKRETSTDVTETKGNNKENIVKEKGGHKLRLESPSASLDAIPPPPRWVLDQTQSVKLTRNGPPNRKGN
jgi:hypothetical protein